LTPYFARCTAKGFTALHVATATGHTDCVVALLKMNPDSNILDNGGRTALIWGAKNKRYDICSRFFFFCPLLFFAFGV
jgi:ankyrin repeat protein